MSSKKSTLPRRQFLSAVSKAGVLGTLSATPLAGMAKQIQEVTALPAEGHIFLTKPYLQGPTPESICINWITNRPCYSWVEYGEGEVYNKKAHHSTDGLVTAYNRVNCIQLKGLRPSTTYRYKIFSKEITGFQPYKLTYGETISSEEYSFTTPDNKAAKASWLILNDIHDRPESFEVLLKLNGADPYDYVFLNGDMFDYQTDEQQIIDHLLKPCTENFATEKPFLFVRGNHETRGRYARELKNYFANINHGQYFSFTQGPVFNIVLDTGEDKEDAHPVYAGIVDFDAYRRQQALWLEQQLQSRAFKKAKFRVVMMHIPHYHSGDAHGTLHCREMFGPLFNKYKIDLLISGHTHKYGVHEPEPGAHNFPIIIGGGPKNGNRTLIRVKADERTLNLQMLRDDGVEVGRYEINTKR
jgi:acid phosphatase type 7